MLQLRPDAFDRLGDSCDGTGQRYSKDDISNRRSSFCAVRRYLRYALSLRNLEEIMAERNVHVDHVTIWRWIQRYAPELSRRCRPELRRTNGSWRVDEIYLRIAGKWTIYLPNGNPQPGPKFDYKLAWVRTFNRARRGADEGRGAGRLGRRLQRRTDCAGHLSNAISR